NIIAGRGCPFDCNYCSRIFHGVRLRSIDNIIAEIIWLKERYGIEGVFFCDDTLTVKKERVYELCDKIQPLGLRWNCQGRVNNVDLEMLRRMKAAGCTAVGYGIESGSQKILNNMNKKATVEQAERALKNTVRAGLYPIVQVMFGYPGETRETLNETVAFFKRADNPGDDLSPVTPLPGTKLWQDTLNKGMVKDEKTLLESLDGGYMPDAPVVLNYTSFSQAEFDSLRIETQEVIRRNYFRRHPEVKFKKFFISLRDNLVRHGCKGTMKKIIVRGKEYFMGKVVRA
ncbi:MAG: radical SAM protein, partial [bacterium]|nr:radical SAM protein [bacterium]